MSVNLSTIKEVFREDFLSPYHVSKNGGDIQGNPVINSGYEGDGSGDYIRYEKLRWASVRNFSIWMDIERLDSVTSQALLSGSTSDAPLIRLLSSSQLQFFISQVVTPINKTVSLSVGDPLKLGVSYDDSTRQANFYVNGTKLSASTFVSGFNPGASVLDLFARIGGNDACDCRASQVRIFSEVLEDADFEALYNDSLLNYRKYLVGSWPFHDKVGDSAPYTSTDISGYGNDLIYGAGTGTNEPDKLAYRNGIDVGSGEFMQTAYNSILLPGDNGTVEVWCRFDSLPAGSHGIAIYNSSDYTNGYLLNQFGSSLLVYWNSASANITASVALQTDIMHHIVLSNDNGTLTVYVNGQMAGSAASGGSIAEEEDTAFGGRGFTSIDGKIYYANRYSSALTSIQVGELYKRGSKYLGNL